MVWKLQHNYADSLPDLFYSRQNPHAPDKPELVIYNQQLADFLLLQLEEREAAEFLSGKIVPPDAHPIAQAYSGHQFGHFTMLGDGRAILLGEQVAADGKLYDIQLKGSGKTLFSRGGDGKATLYSMLREYLISEAMFSLGIPTTRSLAVVRTGEEVIRETVHDGAVLTRVAKGHIRIGTFEYANRFLHLPQLEKLCQYTIDRFYPELNSSPNPAFDLFKKVTQKLMDLVIHWERVGFIHGVMNTDNMSIAGETIDYGPCAFINDYHPEKVFSSIDTQGRYAFGNQSKILRWNLAVFAHSLLPMMEDQRQEAQTIIDEFPAVYHGKWMKMMRSKLGLIIAEPQDKELISNLLEWMTTHQADYTNTFLSLEKYLLTGKTPFKNSPFEHWLEKWKYRINSTEDTLDIMQKTNPSVIPRNHLVENALTSKDFSVFKKFIDLLYKPYSREIMETEYQSPPEGGDGLYKTFCGT
jgi:serine/tyrosine/threonine adenylyltransferase